MLGLNSRGDEFWTRTPEYVPDPKYGLFPCSPARRVTVLRRNASGVDPRYTQRSAKVLG